MEATRELAREGWANYFDSITEDLRNRIVSIEIIDAPNPPVYEARRMALRLLTYDRRDDVFEVAVAQGGPRLPRVLRHRVDSPTRIEVDSATSLAPTRIEVTGGEGVRTVLRIQNEGAFAG
ncbi:MAG: DUF5335 family protein [Solirubrobacteraceae bacterium]